MKNFQKDYEKVIESIIFMINMVEFWRCLIQSRCDFSDIVYAFDPLDPTPSCFQLVNRLPESCVPQAKSAENQPGSALTGLVGAKARILSNFSVGSL